MDVMILNLLLKVISQYRGSYLLGRVTTPLHLPKSLKKFFKIIFMFIINKISGQIYPKKTSLFLSDFYRIQVILCIIVGGVHQFNGHCLIPLGPWLE